METTMTLSQLADLIIVCTFVSICIIGISHVIADLIFLIVSSIRRSRKNNPAMKKLNNESEAAGLSTLPSFERNLYGYKESVFGP